MMAVKCRGNWFVFEDIRVLHLEEEKKVCSPIAKYERVYYLIHLRMIRKDKREKENVTVRLIRQTLVCPS
jgi:hypothetical protein